MNLRKESFVTRSQMRSSFNEMIMVEDNFFFFFLLKWRMLAAFTSNQKIKTLSVITVFPIATINALLISTKTFIAEFYMVLPPLHIRIRQKLLQTLTAVAWHQAATYTFMRREYKKV